MLGAAVDVGTDPELHQTGRDILEHLLEIQIPLGSPQCDHVVDLRVALGVQGGEREVLELGLHVLHAEAVRQRSVDVEGLDGDAVLLLLAAGPPTCACCGGDRRA